MTDIPHDSICQNPRTCGSIIYLRSIAGYLTYGSLISVPSSSHPDFASSEPAAFTGSRDELPADSRLHAGEGRCWGSYDWLLVERACTVNCRCWTAVGFNSSFKFEGSNPSATPCVVSQNFV